MMKADLQKTNSGQNVAKDIKGNQIRVGDQVRVVSMKGSNYTGLIGLDLYPPINLGEVYIVSDIYFNDYLAFSGHQCGEFSVCVELVSE